MLGGGAHPPSFAALVIVGSIRCTEPDGTGGKSVSVILLFSREAANYDQPKSLIQQMYKSELS